MGNISIEKCESRVKEISEYVDAKIVVIKDIPDNDIKIIAYFALLESFAQNYANYVGSTNKNFCAFVKKFQTSCSFLDEIDPVTLFYFYHTRLSGDFDLSFLQEPCYYDANSVVAMNKSKQMIELLKSENIKDEQIKRHTYIKLLYSMRSRLSHEFDGRHSNLKYHLIPNLPYYMSVGGLKKADKKDCSWILIIPPDFVENLVSECIKNYLEYVKKENIDPFQNNCITRRSRLAWYD